MTVSAEVAVALCPHHKTVKAHLPAGFILQPIPGGQKMLVTHNLDEQQRAKLGQHAGSMGLTFGTGPTGAFRITGQVEKVAACVAATFPR